MTDDPAPEPRSPDPDPQDPTADAAPADTPEADASELAERDTAYGLFQRADALMRGRHNAQAALLLERAATLEPGRGSIVEALARARFNAGQHELAHAAFEELLMIDPSSAYGHYGLGQSLKKLGRPDEARTHLRLACALAPESAVYRAALARLG